MIERYHYGFSTCSQKVRLVLAEKRVDFVSHEVDLLRGAQHDPEYVKLNPNDVVPTLVHDGRADRVHSDQRVSRRGLSEPTDAAFQCARTPRRPPVDELLDEKIQAPIAVVTFAIGPRNLLMQQPAEIREANISAIPDQADRAARRSVIEQGVEAAEFAVALTKMVALLGRVEAAITPGGWLSGDSFGLAEPQHSPTCCASIISNGSAPLRRCPPSSGRLVRARACAPILRNPSGELGTRARGGNAPLERTGCVAAGRRVGEVMGRGPRERRPDRERHKSIGSGPYSRTTERAWFRLTAAAVEPRLSLLEECPDSFALVRRAHRRKDRAALLGDALLKRLVAGTDDALQDSGDGDSRHVRQLARQCLSAFNSSSIGQTSLTNSIRSASGLDIFFARRIIGGRDCVRRSV